MHSRRRAALVLLAGVMIMAGCGAKATESVRLGTDAGVSAFAQTSTSSPPPPTTMGLPPVTTTSLIVATVPDVAVDEIDSLLAGFDETLAELDQLLNQAAAALAAEEMEILP